MNLLKRRTASVHAKGIKLFFLLTFCLMSFSILAQNADEKIWLEKAKEGLSLNNFDRAFFAYQKLVRFNPDNLEYKYMAGYCAINTKSDKALALPYFRMVEKQYDPNLKSKFLDEGIYFFMGKSMHLIYEFDSAITWFEKYKSTGKESEKKSADADKNIAIAKYAKDLVSTRTYTSITNLGAPINSEYPEYAPVITADESEMVFTSRRPGSTGGKYTEEGKFYEDIYRSYHQGEVWLSPIGIDTAINSEFHEASVAITVDGDQLIIYKDQEGGGNLYACDLKGAQWSKPKILSENINSKFWEPSASLHPDRTTLYFVSNRLGEERGSDIFVCDLMPDGTWGVPRNLGNVVNTPLDEDAPFIHPNGRTLYFSSTGHNTMGGYDIFRSKLDDYGNWSTPENLGYPINTPDDDVFFVLSANGRHGYFSSNRPGGMGSSDIYRAEFLESGEMPVVVLKGIIKYEGASPTSVGANITVSEQSSGDLIGYFKPNSKSGKFLMVLPTKKNFTVTIEEEGFITYENTIVLEKQLTYIEMDKTFVLSPNNASLAATKASDLKPDSKKEGDENYFINEKKTDLDLKYALPGDQIVLHNIHYDFDKATLRKESFKELDMIVRVLKENPLLVIEISSHTDIIGNPKYNQTLSMQRAFIVSEYLISKGISESSIFAKGYGQAKPLVANTFPDGSDNKVGRQKNRRTEFKILETKGPKKSSEK